MFKKIAAIALIAFAVAAPAHAYHAEQGTNFYGMKANGSGQAASGLVIDGIELPLLSR